MTSRDFCYWLQGFFEINNPTHDLSDVIKKKPEILDGFQLECIENHLKMVFITEGDKPLVLKEKPRC